MENSLIKIENFINKFSPKESFIKLPRSIIVNPNYQAWRSTSRASLVEYLAAYIIRGTNNNSIVNKIFEDFYSSKKLLVARFEDEELAHRLNYKNQKSIVGYIKKLEQEQVIKIHYMPWNNKKIKIYELGFWNKNQYGEYNETLYMYQKFFMLEQTKTLSDLWSEK